MPAYIDYFRQNWNNFWSDAAANVGTVFENIYKTITNVMDNIWAYISSAGTAQLESAWVPVMSGFQKTISEMPEIPRSQVAIYELELQDNINTMQAQFLKGTAKAVEEAMKKGAAEEVAPLKDSVAIDSRVFEDMEEEEEDGKKKKKSSQPKSNVVDSLERGSSEALKAIYANQQQDKTAQKQLSEQKQTNKLLGKIATKEPQRFAVAGAAG